MKIIRLYRCTSRAYLRLWESSIPTALALKYSRRLVYIGIFALVHSPISFLMGIQVSMPNPQLERLAKSGTVAWKDGLVVHDGDKIGTPPHLSGMPITVEFPYQNSLHGYWRGESATLSMNRSRETSAEIYDDSAPWPDTMGSQYVMSTFRPIATGRVNISGAKPYEEQKATATVDLVKPMHGGGGFVNEFSVAKCNFSVVLIPPNEFDEFAGYADAVTNVWGAKVMFCLGIVIPLIFGTIVYRLAKPEIEEEFRPPEPQPDRRRNRPQRKRPDTASKARPSSETPKRRKKRPRPPQLPE